MKIFGRKISRPFIIVIGMRCETIKETKEANFSAICNKFSQTAILKQYLNSAHRDLQTQLLMEIHHLNDKNAERDFMLMW